MPAELRAPDIFHLVPKVHYGSGAAHLAGEAMRDLGVRRALVVSDPGVLGAGVCDPVLASLADARIDHALFTDVVTNPADLHVEAAAARYRRECCDGIIGIGGGSAMDVAKCAAALVSNGGTIREYEDGAKPVTEPWPPLVLVPTTAGSGSEVVGGAIIADSRRVFKMHVVAVPAHAVLCDPVLTLSLPPDVTAASGIDALSHAIGAYVSRERQPLSDAMALYAISVISRWLPIAVERGHDLEAREWMTVGSLSAGISMKGGGAADHAFAHALNALFKLHHGVSVALFLADGMEYNLPHTPERFADIARALGVTDPGRGPEAFGRAAIQAVRELVRSLPIPSPTQLGIDAHIDALVDKVMEDRFHLELNPIPIDARNVRRILRGVVAREAAA